VIPIGAASLSQSCHLGARNRPIDARIEMTDRVYNVLFLCTANSARSIMAEAILNREGKGRFRAYSAGSNPSGAVNQHALDLLKSGRFDVSGFRSKSWDEFAAPGAPEMDFVFTVCDDAAGETCPVWPGQPMTAHWGVPDPGKVTGSQAEIGLAFAEAFRMLATRIGIFVSLPIEQLDKITLHQHLHDIGKGEGGTPRKSSAA
jgi:arsenate reductase